MKIRWLSENSECYFLNLSNIRQPGAENPPDHYSVSESGEGDWQIESRQHGVKMFGRFLKNRDLRENVSLFLFPFPPLSFSLNHSFSFITFPVRQDPEIINLLEGGGNL